VKTNRKNIFKTCTIIVGGAVLIVAAYIMAHGLGLVDSLDFGAGAYYYADIPNYDKIDADGSYHTEVPRWVHIALFLIWGFLMYELWKWVDRSHSKNKESHLDASVKGSQG